MRVMIVFGTRPEAIKLAPIVLELNNRKLDSCVVSTGQHREMLDQVLDIFNIVPDFDLNIMKSKQSLTSITSSVLVETAKIIEKNKPDMVIVQGDTTSAFVAGLAAFYQKIPVAHVEAGLRTNNKYNPFPEEINRRLLSHIADLHFAPTDGAGHNLIREGVDSANIFVTGNTVIDSLLYVAKKGISFNNTNLSKVDFSNKDIILLTTHRRENLDGGMEKIFEAINRITKENTNVEVVFPVHLNPVIGELAKSKLGNNNSVKLLEPLDYTDLVGVMKRCKLVLTDSGGIQEEAPALGKPVLVLRETTERPEGIEAGTGILVGLDTENIVKNTNELLNNNHQYNKMAKAVNPYGEGNSAEQIVDILVEKFK